MRTGRRGKRNRVRLRQLTWATPYQIWANTYRRGIDFYFKCFIYDTPPIRIEEVSETNWYRRIGYGIQHGHELQTTYPCNKSKIEENPRRNKAIMVERWEDLGRVGKSYNFQLPKIPVRISTELANSAELDLRNWPILLYKTWSRPFENSGVNRLQQWLKNG